MVYCPKCGKQNPDDAVYCNNCGASLQTGKRDAGREWDNRCNDTCAGRSRVGLIFWGIVVILIGIWVTIEFGLKNISGLPDWVYSISWGWIFGVFFGLVILIAGISLVLRANKHQ
ncbi:MAG TPA: zinc-ribbon domain-containing protein [Methanomassiliicoccales archaeon]|nr:zinc-ribbon domain-containing protein [Methanomassiliicoccales archaeon]